MCAQQRPITQQQPCPAWQNHPAESVANLERELLAVQREAWQWGGTNGKKVVINAVIHPEPRFLTWIFQASGADRTVEWQLGRSGQLSYVTARARGLPPLLHTYCKRFRSLLGSQINPDTHKAAQGWTRFATAAAVCSFPLAVASLSREQIYMVWGRSARATAALAAWRVRNGEQTGYLLQLLPNSLAGLLSERQTSLLAVMLSLWPHGCRTARTTARVPYSNRDPCCAATREPQLQEEANFLNLKCLSE